MDRFNLHITKSDIFDVNAGVSSSLQDFEDNLAQNSPASALQPGLTPPGLIFYNDDLTSIVFERPPTTIDFSFYKAKKGATHKDKKGTQLSLPIPWQIYFVQFDQSGFLNQLKIYFSYSQVKSINFDPTNPTVFNVSTYNDIPLYQTGLLNIYDSEFVCLDGVKNDLNLPTLEGRINNAYTTFWQSNFNFDLTNQMHTLSNRCAKNALISTKDREMISSDNSKVYTVWSKQTHYDLMDDSKFSFFEPSPCKGTVIMPDTFGDGASSIKLLKKIPILI